MFQFENTTNIFDFKIKKSSHHSSLQYTQGFFFSGFHLMSVIAVEQNFSRDLILFFTIHLYDEGWRYIKFSHEDLREDSPILKKAYKVCLFLKYLAGNFHPVLPNKAVNNRPVLHCEHFSVRTTISPTLSQWATLSSFFSRFTTFSRTKWFKGIARKSSSKYPGQKEKECRNHVAGCYGKLSCFKEIDEIMMNSFS